YPDGFDGEAV
nr:RecName: Full=Putative phosphoenolpyruvate carboxykinase [GTP]; Short=PEPCK; AltName: Full=Newly excysted juvenile protein 1 [Fasciola hepatica]